MFSSIVQIGITIILFLRSINSGMKFSINFPTFVDIDANSPAFYINALPGDLYVNFCVFSNN